MIDEYSLLKSIGKGAFGEVFLTSKEGTDQLFATKKVSKQKADSPKIKKYFINEIAILKEIKHKNIIHFETIKHTIHNYYIITEFCNGGGLSDCLRKYRKKYGKPFSEEIVQHIMRQIVDALKYLHGKKIIHRDIKLDNILVNFEKEEDKDNLNMLKATIKVIDFGFATHLGSANLRYSTLGSPINMDPILLKKLAATNSAANLIGYDEKADIWSLGTVCYEMLIGQGVFNAQNMIELIKKVENGNYHIPTNLSKEVVSFLNGMLQYSAKNRLSAEELSRHYFLTKNVKDFKQIDLTKVSNKIDNKGININIKRNQSIWGIFKEEDEKALIDIPGNILENDKPLKEKDENKEGNPFKKMNNIINIKINNNLNNKNNQKNNANNNNNNNIIKNNLQNQNHTKVNSNLPNNNNKEKAIDYNLLQQQQKLYYQLNLKNNNYKRFANYAYNNPYGFAGVINYNTNTNVINGNSYYYPNGQPIYYKANLNDNTNIVGNAHIRQQTALPLHNANNILIQPQNNQLLLYQQNNQLLLNQQYQQFNNIYGKQPVYVIQNTQNAQNLKIPIETQQKQNILPQGQYQASNNQVINYQNQQKLIKDNRKDYRSVDNTKVSNITNATAKVIKVPAGSRMPKYDNYIPQETKVINLEKKQEQEQLQNKSKEKTKQQIQSNKYKKEEKRQQQELDYKNNNKSIEGPKNNERNQRNKNINENEDKNESNYVNKNYGHKNSHHIKVKKIEDPGDIKHTRTEKQVKIPLDFDEMPNTENLKKDNDEQFNEPFPMPGDENIIDNNYSPYKNEEPQFADYKNASYNYNDEDKEMKKKDSAEELDDLIDFKLGDELCLESEEEKKLDDDNDNYESAKKYMEPTVERPTIGVPPPGTDPRDNYDNDDDCDNGIFQSIQSREFKEFDDVEEI
jgi:serine/threonine protein kinase